MTDNKLAITGGSCLEGGNRGGRTRRRQEEDVEPEDKVDIGVKEQIDLAVQLAKEAAKASGGGPVTVEVGGIKITITPRAGEETEAEEPNKYKRWLDREKELNQPERFPGFAG